MTQSQSYSVKMILIFISTFFLGAVVALPQDEPDFLTVNITDLNFGDYSDFPLLTTTTVKPADETVKLCNNVVQNDGKRTLTLVAADGSYHQNTLTLAPSTETGLANITSLSGTFTIVDPNTGKTIAVEYYADKNGFRIGPYTKRIPAAALASLAGGGLG